MAFARPTLSELVDRIQQDVVSRLMLTAPILRRSMVYVLSRVMAGAAHMLHGHLEYLSKQVFPDQSERDYLVRQAAIFGLARKPAEYATGVIVATGTNGSVIQVETLLMRADGTEYEVYEEATIASGTAGVLVTAKVAGQDGNCGAGVTLTFESPISGVDSTATVDVDGIVNGSDEETLADFSTRVLERMQSPPHGGNAADYVAWAKEVAGVTRAWCYPLEGGAGTVTVRFVRDDDASIIPDAAEVTAVQNHINTVRPVTAIVTVAAPIADAANYTIHLVPDNTSTRAAVEAELKDLLRRIAEPGGTIPISKIRTAIDTAEGVTEYTLTSPTVDQTHATGHLAVHGVVTWT